MIAAMLALVLWAGPMVDGHVHKAAHEGVIVHVETYHVEVVPRGRVLQVWLLDSEEKVLSLDNVAVRLVLGPAQAERAVPLKRNGSHLQGPLLVEDPDGSFSGRVMVTVGKKTHVAKFVVRPFDRKDRMNDGLKL